MKQVQSLRPFPLGGLINGFSGKTLEDAIQEAKEWEENNPVTVKMYYVQQHTGRSILVHYVTNENDNLPR